TSSRGGFGQGERVDGSAAVPPQQYRRDGERPTGINHVVHEEDGFSSKDSGRNGLSRKPLANSFEEVSEHRTRLVRRWRGGELRRNVEIAPYLDAESMEDVVQLADAVLHFFLRPSAAVALEHSGKRQAEFRSESLGEIADKFQMALGGDGCDPFGE